MCCSDHVECAFYRHPLCLVGVVGLEHMQYILRFRDDEPDTHMHRHVWQPVYWPLNTVSKLLSWFVSILHSSVTFDALVMSAKVFAPFIL